MDVLASWGEGMGDRDRPHKWQSWYGLLNTQLASNGGGQRPSLLWKPGMPLDWGRTLVPKETIAAASFSDTYELGYDHFVMMIDSFTDVSIMLSR
jgi:hypothetical protein